MNRKLKEFTEVEEIPWQCTPKTYDKPVTHLLIKGEFRAVCLPNQPMGDKSGTIYPSKVTCRNCIKRVIRKSKQRKETNNENSRRVGKLA